MNSFRHCPAARSDGAACPSPAGPARHRGRRPGLISFLLFAFDAGTVRARPAASDTGAEATNIAVPTAAVANPALPVLMKLFIFNNFSFRNLYFGTAGFLW